MPYPAAPWSLHGYALQTAHVLDIAAARPLVPAELTIVSVFPGKTLGGVYLANYGAGSALQYSELIVVAAIVQRSGKIGPWISHIYVDNPDSVAGGREIWGLPKELADFSWSAAAVEVRQQERSLCTLSYGQPFTLWRQAFAASSFGQLNADLLSFNAKADLRPGLISAELSVPIESPFAALHLGQPWLTVHAEEMSLTIEPPTVLARL